MLPTIRPKMSILSYNFPLTTQNIVVGFHINKVLNLILETKN